MTINKYKTFHSEEEGVINVFIEISKGDFNKYEYNKETGFLELDRIMQTSMSYPANYGFIIGTHGRDGDPLDALVISSNPISSNVVMKAKVLGVLYMEDESGIDEKIICVPENKTDLLYRDINSCSEMDSVVLEKIKHFFRYYKELEKGKWVKIGEIFEKDRAIKLIKDSIIS